MSVDLTGLWFRGAKDSQPFKLSRIVKSRGRQFHSVACFPWIPESLSLLWRGDASRDADLQTRWENMIQQWIGAVAVGSTGALIIFRRLGTDRPLQVNLPESDVEVSNVAWAMNRNDPLKPLLVFTVTSVILIFDVTSRAIVGKLRGHGGPITSLSVHPNQPHLFCTTSRDFTARIYDLTLRPVQTPNNPHWLPHTEPSRAGPAHGLHMCEPEGEGIGQCVAVMVGGRSGGHQAAVMCSAFHPSAPLIATGGMDRVAKIWRIPHSVFTPPPPDQPKLAREDKALFSTDLLHKARVLQISWLAEDILATCSAPALMRRKQKDPDSTYMEEGTVVVWQWLGFKRFFPPGKTPVNIMRGTASDWRNSESFKILSAYHLPLVSNHTHVYTAKCHDPMFLVPLGKQIRMFNISQFAPRAVPKFPMDDIVSMTDKMQLNDDEDDNTETSTARKASKSKRRASDKGTESDDEDNEDASFGDDEGDTEDSDDADEGLPRSFKYPPPAPLTMLFDSVEGWDAVATFQGDDPSEVPDITMCTMGFEGERLVAIGQEGTFYVWHLE